MDGRRAADQPEVVTERTVERRIARKRIGTARATVWNRPDGRRPCPVLTGETWSMMQRKHPLQRGGFQRVGRVFGPCCHSVRACPYRGPDQTNGRFGVRVAVAGDDERGGKPDPDRPPRQVFGPRWATGAENRRIEWTARDHLGGRRLLTARERHPARADRWPRRRYLGSPRRPTHRGRHRREPMLDRRRYPGSP